MNTIFEKDVKKSADFDWSDIRGIVNANNKGINPAIILIIKLGY